MSTKHDDPNHYPAATALDRHALGLEMARHAIDDHRAKLDTHHRASCLLVTLNATLRIMSQREIDALVRHTPELREYVEMRARKVARMEATPAEPQGWRG